jgi:hypothetical protein
VLADVRKEYFDTATIQRQLGIAHDPMTLKGAWRPC